MCNNKLWNIKKNVAIPGFLLAILNWTLDFLQYFYLLFSPDYTRELLHDLSFKITFFYVILIRNVY